MARRKTTPADVDLLAAARDARLRYVNDRVPGIRRIRAGHGFRYVADGGGRVVKADLARIRALAIPPAWNDVWICPLDNGHLQATGRDAKGRKQSRYHADWHTVRERTNFHSMLAFAHALPGLRRRVARDLRLRGLPREKVLAAVVSLLEHTHIRIGNTEYAEENQSFGLSTLRDRHVDVRGDRVEFRFRGKSGKFHSIDHSDAQLARIVERCQDLPGYELFQYLDDGGEPRDVTSDGVNDYLRETAGEEFTAKDFRTWAGTVRAAQFLRRQSGDGKKKPAKTVLVKACDEVAAALGNTRAVCRRHYIHPAVFEAYLDGTLAACFENDRPSARARGLKPEEKAVVRLLKENRP
jgi:DNA topoisomerase-1